MLISGQPDRAQPLLTHSRTLLVKTGSLPASILALIILGEVLLSRGELRQAESFFRQALAHAHEHEDLVRLQVSHYEHLAYYELVQLLYDRNDLEQAQQ